MVLFIDRDMCYHKRVICVFVFEQAVDVLKSAIDQYQAFHRPLSGQKENHEHIIEEEQEVRTLKGESAKGNNWLTGVTHSTGRRCTRRSRTRCSEQPITRPSWCVYMLLGFSCKA